MRYLIFSCLILLCGCTTSELFKSGGPEERSDIGYISVTSTPSDAEVYINDRLVGRTPSDDVPFSYKYKVWRQPLGLDFGNPDPYGIKRYGHISDNTLRVSKKGYKDVFETINPEKRKYHFDLKPETSSQSHSEPEAISPSATDSGGTPDLPSHGLRLEAILFDTKQAQAIIDGKVMKTGEKINGNSLVDIRKDKVILYDGEKNFELQLK